jgi:hypothetical protein
MVSGGQNIKSTHFRNLVSVNPFILLSFHSSLSKSANSLYHIFFHTPGAMNLLKTDTYEVVRVSRSPPPYAILSHRWEAEEITYDIIKTIKPSALHNPSFPAIPTNLRPSAAKIRGACTIAQRQGFKYIWIDTCCIDKTKSEELRYALNMMFKWYRDASICYTYLNDVVFSAPNENMFLSDRQDRRGQPSEWFERGWTLQELLAPREMQFFDKRWRPMGTRNKLAILVGRIAGIDPDYLSGKRDLSKASCATKMSWMAGRITRDVEDIAYSLIGIFDVFLTPIYGEGAKAFFRLQEAIMTEYGRFDESLFAWETPQDSKLRCYKNTAKARDFCSSKWGLLAPSPDCFRRSGDIFVVKELVEQRQAGGFGRSHQGIFFTLPAREVNHRFGGSRNEIIMPLNCWRGSHDVPEAIILRLSRIADNAFVRTQCGQLCSQKGAKVGRKGNVVVSIPQPQLGQDLGSRSSQFR